MPLAPFIAQAFAWLFREAILKFVIMAACYAVVAELLPVALGWLAPFVGLSNFQTLFGSLSAQMWYGFNLVSFGFGFNLVVSAYGARFFIRRLPVIG